MKTNKKLLALLAAGSLMVPIALGMGTVSTNAAEEGSIDFNLHKRVFGDKDGLPVINEGGAEISNPAGNPLAGVTFTAYNVTQLAYDLSMASDDSAYDPHADLQAIAQGIFSKNYVTKNGIEFDQWTDMGSQVASGITADKTGIVTFSLAEKTTVNKANDKTLSRDSVYVFVETNSPLTIKDHAAPIVVTLPLGIDDEEGVYKPLEDVIHIYPKNVEFTADEEKVLDDEEDALVITVPGADANDPGMGYRNVKVGDVLPFYININVPASVANLTSFTVTDTPDPGLWLEENTWSVVVTDPDSDSETDEENMPAVDTGAYTLTPADDDGGFTVTFNVTEMEEYAGHTVRINFNMIVTDEIVPDVPTDNTAKIVKNDTEVNLDSEDILTGGAKFKKIDGNTEKALEGAGFTITQKEDDKIVTLKFQKSGNEYIYAGTGIVSEDEKDVGIINEIKSGEGGLFAIRGLLAGDYVAEETKVPTGYVKMDDTTFTIKYGSYADVNLHSMENIRKGILPSTGGTGIVTFVAIGASLMLGAVIWYRSTKRRGEEV